jgi:hypothetical protein
MTLQRIFEALGKPKGRRIVVNAAPSGGRTTTSMLIWGCSEEACESVCIARNAAYLDLSTSIIPDNGGWELEPCARHAHLFNDSDLA